MSSNCSRLTSLGYIFLIAICFSVPPDDIMSEWGEILNRY